MRGVGEGKTLQHDANDHPADDVDEDNEQARNCIAADEFGGAIHGTEESAFIFQGLPPPARFFLVDKSSRQIGVDRHLLAGALRQGESERPLPRYGQNPW